MKLIFIFMILFSLSFIFIENSQAHGLEYKDDKYGFSIDYPEGWDIENTLISEQGIDILVTFYDDIDGWSSMLEVRHYPDSSFIQTGSDQQWLNSLNQGLKQGCELYTIEEFGFTCSNHSLIDSRIVYIDEKKSYQLIYSWTETWEDSTQLENISISTFVPDGFDTWSIESESASDVYSLYKDEIFSSINSFDILKETSETAKKSESESDKKIVFESNIFSYLDWSQTVRPLSLVKPSEFTPEWYTNEKHGFAIRFPHSVEDNWTINDNFSGRKITEMSSMNTNGKIEIFKEQGDLYQKFHDLSKNQLYQESEKLVSETVTRFSGFFHVDAVTIVEFNDGFLIAATFFKITDNGNPQIYDVTYLIFETGEIFEMLYYGDNYSAISLDELSIMVDTLFLGDISTIPIVNKASAESELYVSDKYGFSFIPPKNWKPLEVNNQFEAQSAPVTFEIIKSFLAPNSQGFIPTQMAIGYSDFGDDVDLENFSDKEIMQDMIAGFLDTAEKVAPAKILDSSIEHFEHSLKVTMTVILTHDLEGVYIEQQMELVSWQFDNGETYFFVLVTSPEDYDYFISDFNNSVETISFKPKAKPSTTETEITESDDGGCLIATATYGSELSIQVQQLRELRDNKLLQTESGIIFMESFNSFYYSFSPYIADYERENPVFKEVVKLFITPMISSLSILNNVDMDSESEVLGYGISLIILNLGMYVGIPAFAIIGFRKKFQ